MAKEYIEREAAIKIIRGEAVAKYPDSFYVGLIAASNELNVIPAADVAPVVRCRDCRYCDPSNGIFWCDRFDSAVQIDGMAYCSYGKRKLKEDNQCSNT